MTTPPDAPRIHDVATGTTSTLRVARVRDREAGDMVVLSHGYGRGADFLRPSFCGDPIRLPASALTELRAALEALEGER